MGDGDTWLAAGAERSRPARVTQAGQLQSEGREPRGANSLQPILAAWSQVARPDVPAPREAEVGGASAPPQKICMMEVTEVQKSEGAFQES